MAKKETIQALVNYFKTDQWQELMRQLTQTEEELYHTHVYVRNSIDAYSICNLLEKYFERKGIPLDRKIDLIGTRGTRLAAHSVHPHAPGRAVSMPAFDFFWEYDENVVLEPSDPSKMGEEGKNIITWGKKFMDNFYKQFDFKCVGPKEELEIAKWFQSAHWKKALRFIEDPAYDHVHTNVEINFDPWILKVFAIDALKEISWKVDRTVPCVFHGPRGYIGKMVFLGAHPEEVYDIAWWYNPEVVIRPATFDFAGHPPEGEIAYDVCFRKMRDEVMAKGKYVQLSDEEIETVLKQVV